MSRVMTKHNSFATSMDPDQPAHPTLLQVEKLIANSMDPCLSQTHYVGIVMTLLIY
jgi:hypothetical protein